MNSEKLTRTLIQGSKNLSRMKEETDGIKEIITRALVLYRKNIKFDRQQGETLTGGPCVWRIEITFSKQIAIFARFAQELEQEQATLLTYQSLPALLDALTQRFPEVFPNAFEHVIRAGEMPPSDFH